MATFTLRAGESASFVLEDARGRLGAATRSGYVAESFKETMNYWRSWVGAMPVPGALARDGASLGAHAEAARLAAYRFAGGRADLRLAGGDRRRAQLGLPLHLDSRCLVHDLCAHAARLHRGSRRLSSLDRGSAATSSADGSLQIMYGFDGRRELTEETLPTWPATATRGQCASATRPTRQLQLDIYGELMDSVYLYNKYGAADLARSLEHLVRLIDWVCETGSRPDEGIWEVRGGQQEFLYSRLMCWVAIDRGDAPGDASAPFPAPLARWTKRATRSTRRFSREFWDAESGSLHAAQGHDGPRRVGAADAAGEIHQPDRSALALDAAGHRPKTWSRIRWSIGTASTTARRMGCKAGEGHSSMCTFWYVECLARAGDVQKARFIFEKMLGYANHVGLYAEELGPRGEHLGNFPQAFTHLGLISAAFDLDRRLSAAGHPTCDCRTQPRTDEERRWYRKYGRSQRQPVGDELDQSSDQSDDGQRDDMGAGRRKHDPTPAARGGPFQPVRAGAQAGRTARPSRWRRREGCRPRARRRLRRSPRPKTAHLSTGRRRASGVSRARAEQLARN